MLTCRIRLPRLVAASARCPAPSRFTANAGSGSLDKLLRGKEALVIALRTVECPVSQKYGHRLADLEREYRVTGGHWHHTEFALDQALMMRPTYEAAQYQTPVPGLYLCGAGCHPGGDLSGGPGHNAAREILR